LQERSGAVGSVAIRVSKSQVAFRRKRAFAWAWIPGKYLRGRHVAPLVLTLSLHRREPSSRWKEIVEPEPGRFTHHLEIYSPEDIDHLVLGWIREAWETAG
jgi:hypothetical protein